MLEQFYEKCLRFWKREGVENPEELALNDVKNLKYDPFSPNGEPIDEKLKFQLIENKKPL